MLSGEYTCIEKKARREKHQVGLDMCESGFGRSQLTQEIQQHADTGNSGQAHPRYCWRTLGLVMHSYAVPNYKLNHLRERGKHKHLSASDGPEILVYSQIGVENKSVIVTAGL